MGLVWHGPPRGEVIAARVGTDAVVIPDRFPSLTLSVVAGKEGAAKRELLL